MTDHPQVKVSIHGESVLVDRKIRSLILAMNNLPGIRTFFSCQGGPVEYESYVSFGGPGALILLPEFARRILAEEQKHRMRHRHVCRGCRGPSIRLTIGFGSIALRWRYWDYRRVFRMVQEIGSTGSIDEPEPEQAFSLERVLCPRCCGNDSECQMCGGSGQIPILKAEDLDLSALPTLRFPPTRDELAAYIQGLAPCLREVCSIVDRIVEVEEDTLNPNFQIASEILEVFMKRVPRDGS